MIQFPKILSQGLLSGFAGKAEIEAVKRHLFDLQSSHYQNENGVYHDEWAADRVGGGQELVKTDQGRFTRVYAGGTIPEEALLALGISKEEVMRFLIASLQKQIDQTRQETDCLPEAEGDWQYQYHVLERNFVIPYTLGKEEIFYQKHVVFVHLFISCPVE
jgi:hypothetical protein